MQDKGLVTVEAQGVGKTPDEALKDALRNSVQQVVGALIDTETLIKNDQVISDKVLTFSDGYITASKVIEEKQEGDLYVRKIRATVARTKISHTLNDANLPVKKLDGESMFAELVHQIETEKDAKALLEKAFDGFPANLLKAEVLGKPEPLDKSETHVVLGYNLVLGFDREKYQAFLEKTVPLLRKVASQKGFFLAGAEPVTGQERYLVASFFPREPYDVYHALVAASHCEPVMRIKHEAFIQQWCVVRPQNETTRCRFLWYNRHGQRQAVSLPPAARPQPR